MKKIKLTFFNKLTVFDFFRLKNFECYKMNEKLQEEFELINAFGPIIKELKSLLNDPNYFISEHVDKLINKIDIRREERIFCALICC